MSKARLVLLGTVTKDPKSDGWKPPDGDREIPLTRFRVRTDKASGGGDLPDAEDVVDCTAWGDREAEFCATLRKGDKVVVVGEGEWRSHDGRDYFNVNARCTVVTAIAAGGKASGGGEGKRVGQSSRAQERRSRDDGERYREAMERRKTRQDAPAQAKDDFDDDIPF